MIKVIDLFAGVGGLSYGFANHIAFEVVAANEILKNMAEAYALNHPNVKVYNTDIADFGKKAISQDFGDVQIDLVVGGPPCQAYSTVGKRLIDDPRGKLFTEYARVLKELRPSVFIFENVTGLLSMQKGKLFDEILSMFRELGYKVNYNVLNAADYGVPQHRERVIVVGSLISESYEFPEPSHTDLKSANLFSGCFRHLTIADALSDLPLISAGESRQDYLYEPQNELQKFYRQKKLDTVDDHTASSHNPSLLQLMDMLPEGGTPLDIPYKYRPSSGFANSYSRLWWNRPSTTLTRNFGTPSSARCIHPKVPRALTTREGARLQSFPDDYKFYGSRSEKNLQIGNAVPPLLSVALAKSIAQHFED